MTDLNYTVEYEGDREYFETAEQALAFIRDEAIQLCAPKDIHLFKFEEIFFSVKVEFDEATNS